MHHPASVTPGHGRQILELEELHNDSTTVWVAAGLAATVLGLLTAATHEFGVFRRIIHVLGAACRITWFMGGPSYPVGLRLDETASRWLVVTRALALGVNA